MTDKVVRILAVDDHPVVRRGIAAILNSEASLVLVGEAVDGDQAIAKYASLRPDIVLMDLRLPGKLDGLDATEQICKQWPEARIIILTTYAGDENIHRALEAGARGYLLKDALDDELLAAVKKVCAGKVYLPAEVSSSLFEAGIRIELTEREQQVIELLSQGLRNKELAGQLEIAPSTARRHTENVMAKLGASTRTEAVRLAAQRGFLRRSNLT